MLSVLSVQLIPNAVVLSRKFPRSLSRGDEEDEGLQKGEKKVEEMEKEERRRRSMMGSWADVALFKNCCVIKDRRTEA